MEAREEEKREKKRKGKKVNPLYLLMVPFLLHQCFTQSHDIFGNWNADLLIK